ncbi:MAG TPA: prepilin peptidase [Azospirillaceae bacterium]|nr:prepilin peptidase [Azospirillaceae bacterium]
MDVSLHAPLLGPAVAAGLLLWAAIGDIARYLIPNRIPAALVLAFLVQAAVAGTAGSLAAHLLTGAAVLAVCILLFAMNVIGGGDAKLLAATALWAGPAATPLLILVMGVAGGLLALAMLLHHRLRAPEGAEPPRRIPYGVAIAAGGVAALFLAPAA